jgi:hypothetical protein
VRLRLLGLLPAVTLAACGSAGGVGGSESPASVVRLDCGVGSARFDASTLARGVVTDQRDGIAAGLRRYVAAAGQDAPRAFWHHSVDGAPWHVLSVDGEEAAVATGHWSVTGPGRDGQVWTLHRAGTTWSVDGGGDCAQLELVPAQGHVWATLTAPAGGLDRRGVRPLLLLTPRTCGRPEHVDPPDVVESARTVTVRWSVPRPDGNVTCVGWPALREHLPLAHPLGSRTLLDGSRYPPAPVR